MSVLARFPARSYLFVPGDRPERIPKAHAAGADAVIVDLEDAVAPAAKLAARDAVAASLDPRRPVYVRVNDASSRWFREDLRVCAAPGVAGIVLPKAESVDHVRAVVEVVGDGVRVVALIETARGIDRAEAIAACAWVERLAFGALDLQVDLGIGGDGEELNYFRSRLVLASRLAGIAAPVDGVTTALDDAAALQYDIGRARRFGFGGKLCIHPKQVAAVNRGFAPSAEEVAWARRVVAAARATPHGAVALDGKMIDRPVLARAEAILRGSEDF